MLQLLLPFPGVLPAPKHRKAAAPVGMMIRFVKDLVGLAQGAAKTSQGGRSRNRDLHKLLHVRFQIARLVREFNGQIAKSLVVGTQHHLSGVTLSTVSSPAVVRL